MVVARKYLLVRKSEGLPKPSDFKLVEEELPPLKENGKFYRQFNRLNVGKNNFIQKLIAFSDIVGYC